MGVPRRQVRNLSGLNMTHHRTNEGGKSAFNASIDRINNLEGLRSKQRSIGLQSDKYDAPHAQRGRILVVD